MGYELFLTYLHQGCIRALQIKTQKFLILVDGED